MRAAHQFNSIRLSVMLVDNVGDYQLNSVNTPPPLTKESSYNSKVVVK